MKTFLKYSLAVLLIVLTVAFAAVGCTPDDQGGVTPDKTALRAEIALEITEQGDYTAASYEAYAAKLAAAKALADDAAATQKEIDEMTAALTAARGALTLRTVEAVAGADKQLGIFSGNTEEIVISDYVNVNGLSKITYDVSVSNPILTASAVENGAFTITADEVNGMDVVLVAIDVSYDGVKKLAVQLTVTVTNDATPILDSQEVVREYDLFDLENKNSIVLDFSANVNNICGLPLTYSAKHGGEELVLTGTSYTFTFGTYTEQYTYEEFTVTITCTVNGEEKTLEYTYRLGLRDTRAYQVANGDFENGLDGWTLNNTVGEAPFGGIDGKTTFWDQAFPMNNVGSYFSAYATGAQEASQGTLASPYFTVRSDWATYLLSGGGNPNVYITIEDRSGNVLALFRNTRFADLPAGELTFDQQRELIGESVFLCNFVTYKVPLSDLRGEEIRFVVHDHASEGWGVVFFDELNTYYAAEAELPAGAVLAENLLADKADLEAELAQEETEQGDYTQDSYQAYTEKLAAAKAIADDIAVTQATVDQVTAALSEARLALTVRPVEEVSGANKTVRLTSGGSKELLLSDYVNTNGLSAITYGVAASSGDVTLGTVADGRFTVTAGEVADETTVTVTVTVYYGGTQALAVDLTLEIAEFLAPVVKNETVVEEYDLYDLGNKTNLTLDFSENIANEGGVALTFAAQHGGTPLTLDGTSYTFPFGTYGETVTNEVFTVTVTYTGNSGEQTLTYTYTLALKDTTANRLANGDFENGLDGWTVVGNIGDASSDTHYWLNDPENADGYAFGMDGEGMFSAYAPGATEAAVGTLTSSSFTVGGSGFVTFKVGAMKDGNYVYVDVVDATTKQILARYYNGLWADRTEGAKSGCTLVAYKADLSAFLGREVFFRISDNADSGYGLFFADSFVTYYPSEPEGFADATPVDYEVTGTIYDLFNGGFELGDVQGWWNNGAPGKVTAADAFWNGRLYGKNGTYLYSGVQDQGGEFLEGNMGTLTSSVFEIGGTGYISFMLGGGGNQLCFVQVIDAVTGEILARYHQQALDEGVLVQYVADLSAYIGRAARIQVVDKATSDWGCVSFDHVVTYYPAGATLPEGITATDVKYELANGSFENGLGGWTMNVTEAGEHNTLGWVQNTEIDAPIWYTKNDTRKDGDYLFTFVTPENVNCEKSKGTLTSASFVLKQNAYVSFRFGAAGTRDVRIELCRADGTVIATFYNEADGKANTELYAYYYQYTGEEAECFFRIVDDSVSNYGCFVVDDFKVNLESAPEGYLAAIQ